MFNKYRELGLSLIPIKKGEKRPDFNEGWQVYCERLPTEDECDLWEMRKGIGYGLTCGPASNIIGIDIDTDDKAIIDAVPLSPVRKRGRKGETRFFRYDPEVPSCKVAGIIDVLSLGRQTVMPPSVHPETGKPYIWLTDDTLENYDVKDLPVFTAKMLSDLQNALQPNFSEVSSTNSTGVEITGGPWFNNDPKRGCPHGSQDRLKVIANAMVSRGVSPDEAVRELLRYDEENHKPVSYFADSTRAECTADPVTNALFFYASNLKTFNRRQVKSGQMPSVPMVSGAELLEIGTSPIVVEAWKAMDWPEPKGLLKDLVDQISDFSYRKQPGIALGGAIAIAAAALSNRMKFKRTWPNVYVLNVAPTGAGKSFPYDVAKRILNPENDLDLLGSGGFRSSTALIKDLVGRRERLDLLDECSGLFKTIRDGGVFQADMMDLLNALWAESNTVFIGPESAGRERVNVWHPCISALFSTTPDGLKGSINREFITQGFIPRCLIFHDAEYGKLGKSIWDEARAEKIVKVLVYFKDLNKTDKRNLVSPRPDPMDIPISVAAEKYLDEYGIECSEKLAESDCDEIERHFLSRAAQQASKLALIHGALRGMMIDVDDVKWAINTLQAVWHNANPIMPQMGAENTQEINVIRVLQIIKKVGSITHSRLIGKTRFLRTNERNEILGSLEGEGKIACSVNESRSKVWSVR